jgi:hypothetical protein
MAESVDALVSNTNGCKAVPVRPRLWVQVNNRKLNIRLACGFFYTYRFVFQSTFIYLAND